jgi:hypothetical protein
LKLNPLQIIESWLTSLEPEARLNIFVITKPFHPEKSVRESERIEAFMDYLKCDNLDLNEMIFRTVKAIKLIDFAIYDKEAESKWRPTIDINTNGRNFNPEDEQTKKALDWIFSGYSVEKETWLKLCKGWNDLLKDHFVDTAISDMYFSEIRTYTKSIIN